MTAGSKVWIGAAAIAAAVGLFFLNGQDDVDLESSTFARPVAVSSSTTSNDSTSIATAESPHTAADLVEQKAAASEESSDTFRVDAGGNLKEDEQTRLGIESLLALTEPDKVPAALSELTKSLPPAAARRAEELVDRFKHFTQAQKQSYPSGVAPLTEDDALVQLDGLHALRAAHFGPETAEALYGREEKLSRELIELMRHEKDQSLTMWEKAEKAQALHDQLPTVAAIEKKNRESAAAAEEKENR